MLSAVGGRNEPPAGQPHHGSPTVRPAAAPAKEAAAVVPIMAGKGEGRVAGASYHVSTVASLPRPGGGQLGTRACVWLSLSLYVRLDHHRLRVLRRAVGDGELSGGASSVMTRQAYFLALLLGAFSFAPLRRGGEHPAASRRWPSRWAHASTKCGRSSSCRRSA